MKIGVCVKEVPDTATKIEIRPDGLSIQDNNIKYIMNPYDEFAIEEALRFKDKDPAAEVVVFTLGPERAVETLRKALSMGADRAIHIKENALPFGEGFLVATLLSKLAGQEKLDALYLGKQAVDDDASQVGPMLAGLLGWSQAMNVIELKVEANRAVATREVEGGTREILELHKPFVVGFTKGINEPRYASLKGIMAAKKKEIKTLTASDFGVDMQSLCRFTLNAFTLPPERKAVKMITGEPEKAAAELVRLLREEAKVI